MAEWTGAATASGVGRAGRRAPVAACRVCQRAGRWFFFCHARTPVAAGGLGGDCRGRPWDGGQPQLMGCRLCRAASRPVCIGRLWACPYSYSCVCVWCLCGRGGLKVIKERCIGRRAAFLCNYRQPAQPRPCHGRALVGDPPRVVAWGTHLSRSVSRARQQRTRYTTLGGTQGTRTVVWVHAASSRTARWPGRGRASMAARPATLPRPWRLCRYQWGL